MGTLADHPAIKYVKLLNVGESGSGKTGALVSLVEAGYKLHTLDYDNGLDIVANILRQKNPKLLERVEFETFMDKKTFVGGKPQWKAPTTAFNRAGPQLAAWGAEKWTDEDICVLDTLTMFTEAGFHQACFDAGRLNGEGATSPRLQEYGVMAERTKIFLQTLCDPDAKFHVIVNTHIRYFEADPDTLIPAKGLPNAKGQEVSRTVSTFFNTCVLTHTVGAGPATRRQISTQPQGVVQVKTSNPISVKPIYSLETGLADLFADILGKPGPAKRNPA